MASRRARRVAQGTLMALIAAYSLFPIYFITVQSLKTPQEDVFGSPLWVTDPSFENYTELFEGAKARPRGFVILPRVPFLDWLANSALVLAGSLAVTLAAAVLAAYALGRLQPPGWRWWRRALFATYVVPHTILFVPLYQVIIRLGLDDSHGALVLIYSTMALPFCVWILSAYYQHLPREIEEAALIEGASPATAFVRIVLPMSRNVLIAAALFTVGTVGNDFMLASIFLLDPTKQTVAAGLGVMDVSLEELVTVAGVNLAAIPVAAACAVFARGYVRGLTAAMVEGA
ncbi:MAG: carbohydrate ABC transporter permease [Candidatus Rokubacteria bacterium]|nr:carbohydrate ABC transporter permease [Candidatus Rokubacteria bacterium]